MLEPAESDPFAHSGRTRDFRIDFFRGLALYMILVDHIAFNPLAKFTYQRFGFSDAAEIFVFLSGISCGIVYHSVLTHSGVFALIAALIKRAALIYLFYLAASAATILLVASTADLISELNRCLVGCVESIFGALWSATLLSGQPSLPSILVLYMALTMWVFPILLIGVRIHPALMLAVSGSIWAITQLYQPAWGQITGFPYFNPLAWQFLFSIGLFLGTRYRRPDGLRSKPLKWLLATAVLVVVVGLLSRLPQSIASTIGFDPCWLQFCDLDVQRDKYNLAPHRLIHILGIALLVANFVSSDSAVFKWGGGFVVKTGQWSLQIFSIGAVLSVLLTLVFAAHSFSFVEKLAFNLGAITLTALLAITLTDWSQRRRTLRAEASAKRRNPGGTPRARMVRLLSPGIQVITIPVIRHLWTRRQRVTP